jgi:hypothetical protein
LQNPVLEKSRLKMLEKLADLEKTPEALALIDDLMTQNLTMTLLAKAIVYEGRPAANAGNRVSPSSLKPEVTGAIRRRRS